MISLRTRLFRLNALIFAAAVMGASHIAIAQTTQPADGPNRALADDHVRIGVQDFNARLFREAAHEFEIAYQLSQDPLLFSNIGTARLESGDLAGAREAFAEFLRRSPDAPNRDAIRARLDEVDRQLASMPPADMATVTAAPSSAPPAATVTSPAAPSSAPMISGARIAGLVIGGVGVITAGAGIGLWAGVDANFQTCHSMGGCTAAEEPRTLDTVSVVMIYGGAALAVGGALLAIFARQTSTPREHAHRPAIRWTHFALIPNQGVFAGGEF